MARKKRRPRPTESGNRNRSADHVPAASVSGLNRWDWLFLLAVALAVFVLYLPAWGNRPLWDDERVLFEPEPPFETPLWQAMLALAPAMMLAAVFAVRRWTRAPLAAATLLAIGLAPAMCFLNVDPLRHSFTPDRFQYFAGLAVLALVTGTAALGLQHDRRWARAIGQTACLVLVVLLAGLSWRQCRMYADVQAHNDRAATLAKAGFPADAIDHCQQALALNPDSARAHAVLASVLVASNRSDQLPEAIEHYEHALELKPDRPELLHVLGNALAKSGQLPEAIDRYEQALEIQPEFAETHQGLADVLLVSDRGPEAIEHYREALRLQPNMADAHRGLGNALGQQRKSAEALDHRRKAVRLQPRDLVSMNNMAWVLATDPDASVRNGMEAVKWAQRVIKFRGSGPFSADPAILDTAAAAYAEASRFAEAAATAERALVLAVGQNNAALADSLRARIKLYQAGSAFHETLGTPPAKPASP